jgi:hypothetical protein
MRGPHPQLQGKTFRGEMSQKVIASIIVIIFL